jgi:hypothetical protein
MAKKKKSGSRNPKNTPQKQNPQKQNQKQNPKAASNQPPKWGILVAGLFAFLMVSAAIVIMDKIGIDNQTVRTVVVLVLAVTAGLGARPLTLALQRRFTDN